MSAKEQDTEMVGIYELPQDIGEAFREGLPVSYDDKSDLKVSEDLRLLLCDLAEIFDGTSSGNLNQAAWDTGFCLGSIYPNYTAAELGKGQRDELKSCMENLKRHTRTNDDVAKTVTRVLEDMHKRFFETPKPVFKDIPAKRNGKPIGTIKVAFHGAGTTSYEDLPVEKVKDGSLYLVSDEGPSDQFVFDMASGHCTKDPNEGFGGFSRTIKAADFKPA